MATILISGGTGLIGTYLCPLLEESGYEIALLSRSKNQNHKYRTFNWDPENNMIEEGAIESADFIIHLAGANLGEKRWTPSRKRSIIESRVNTANLLFEQVSNKRANLKAFICSSAVGFYGTAPSNKVFNEDDPPGKDFLSTVCVHWEKAADQFEKIGIRTVKIRSGVVLTHKGGALEKMKLPVQFGLGSPLGNGKQNIPWIHMEDLCSIYLKAVEEEKMMGAYNAVAPDQATNAEFMRLIASTLKKPFFLPPVPGLLLKILLGEKSTIVLNGNKVSDEKIIREGFIFKFPYLKDALRFLLK